MASRKSSYDVKGLPSKMGIEGIVIRDDIETPWKKPPVSQKTPLKQKSETEKAFARQEKGIKNALKLF